MFLFRGRFVAILFASLTLLGALVMPLSASAQGNSENAKACQKGGWATLARTEAPRTAFLNQDECVSYGAQGGTIVPLVTTDLSISGGLHEYTGVISGTGFTPNSTIVVLIRLYTPSGTVSDSLPTGYTGIDATGAFAR